MKPHLRLFRKVWDCRRFDWRKTGVIGFGFSPSVAYLEWKNLQAKYDRAAPKECA